MDRRHHRASFPGCGRIAWTLLYGVWLAAMPAAADEIYRWTDANGNVHFGNRKPAGAVPDVQATQGGTLNQAGGTPPADSAAPATAAPPYPSPQADDSKARLRRLRKLNKQSAHGSSKPILIGGGGQVQAGKPSENSCQASYGKSCDEVENWREKAVEDCKRKDSAHCDDPNWIDRQKPKTLEQQQELKDERRDNARARFNRAQKRNR